MASISNLWSVFLHALTESFKLSSCSNRRFYAFMGGNSHIVEQDLHKKYGHVVRIAPNTLTFSDLPSFEAIYSFNKFLEKGDFWNFGREGPNEAGNIFTARTNACHKDRKRKVFGLALTNAKVATYKPTISKNVSNLILRLNELRAASEDKSTIDIAETIHRYTVDNQVDIVYGQSVCPVAFTDWPPARGVIGSFESSSRLIWGILLLPILGKIMRLSAVTSALRRPTHDASGNETGIGSLVSAAQKVVRSEPEKITEVGEPCILRYFLDVKESDSKYQEPDQVLRESVNLMFAGQGSQAAALTATLYYLAIPIGHQWQRWILADQNSEADMPLAASSILMAVMKETVRLHAPIPTGFPRTIMPGAETAIPGLPAPLPTGTDVQTNPYVLSRSKEIWGEDAEEWKPQRWLVETDAERKELDEKFVTFGKGPRACIGKEMAWIVIAKAVTAILQQWKISAEERTMKGANYLEMHYHTCKISFVER